MSDDMASLFRKDPEALTVDDLVRIIARYQEARINPTAFNPKTGEPKTKKRRRRKADPRQLGLFEETAT
jgi:hypothetical protein